VGANTGEYSEQLSKTWPNAIIHAFEPGPDASKEFESRNIEVARLRKIALSNTAGTAKYKMFGKENSHINTLITDSNIADERGFQIVEIEADTGDNYCKLNEVGQIDFLKVDVEGYELKVLEGFKDMLDRGRVKAIQFEYGFYSGETNTVLKNFFQFFADKPYSLFKVRRNSLEPLNYSFELNNFRSGPNFLAVHSDFLKKLEAAN
jgi:FkbM family methyltransferase